MPKPRNTNKSGNKRDGDWDCPSCGANCFASRDSCFKCGTEKSAGGNKKGSGRKRDGEKKDRKKPKENFRRSDPSDVFKEQKLNMRNIKGDSPPQQAHDYLSFITERTQVRNKIGKLLTLKDMCECFGFSTEEKHMAEAFSRCEKFDDISKKADYISGRYSLLNDDAIDEILTTLVVIKQDLVLEKVEKCVIRSCYLESLYEMTKVKQNMGKYGLKVKMKALCIHSVITGICKSLDVGTGMAE